MFSGLTQRFFVPPCCLKKREVVLVDRLANNLSLLLTEIGICITISG